jgi:hypothetical protein
VLKTFALCKASLVGIMVVSLVASSSAVAIVFVALVHVLLVTALSVFFLLIKCGHLLLSC